jgi:hypothetical protein
LGLQNKFTGKKHGIAKGKPPEIMKSFDTIK